jgi:hypothetical protein
MNTTNTLTLTPSFSLKLAGSARRTASILGNVLMYGFLALTTITAYSVLPDLVKSIKYDCKFKTITQKTTVAGTDKSFFTFDDGSQSWDKSNFSTGDLVCVKR